MLTLFVASRSKCKRDETVLTTTYWEYVVKWVDVVKQQKRGRRPLSKGRYTVTICEQSPHFVTADSTLAETPPPSFGGGLSPNGIAIPGQATLNEGDYARPQYYQGDNGCS